MTILSGAGKSFDVTVPIVIIGAGACGLIAALSARDAGVEVLVIERDQTPAGSTALSSGFIPAAGTRFQKAIGVEDTPALLEKDVMAKSHDEAEPNLARTICAASARTIEWLADRHGVEFFVLDNFMYPGHSVARMHAVPEKTGVALMAALARAAESAGVDVITEARATHLYADADGRVRGVRYERPDGTTEDVGCEALILACSGFGGSSEMVKTFIPEIADALFFGHVGNQGDAIRWGQALGATVRDMTAYQGHGSVATPHGVLITWAIEMEGGIQVNRDGVRFANEHQGYSEAAVFVLSQPDGVAWDIFDERVHQLGMTFPDYQEAAAAGAIKSAPTIEALADRLGLPREALASTIAATHGMQRGERADEFGRDFTAKPPLKAPFYGVKVTGALFHTQGGLLIDETTRVLRTDGSALPNLYAGGGAACGISGAHVWGYLSGNGLLAATNLGRLSGEAAARQVNRR